MEKEDIQYWSKKYDEQYPWWIRKEKELGDKLRRSKELTKDDLVQITEWKFKITPLILPGKLRDVAKNDDAEIRRISRHVFSSSPKDDSDRIDSLCELYGVGPALASVILTFYDPKQYGVFDKHVWRELFGKVPKYLYTTENVLKVLSELRRIAGKYNLDVRTVEKAFFKKNFDGSASTKTIYEEKQLENGSIPFKKDKGRMDMLVRNHLLCPYSNCVAHHRGHTLRIQVLVNDDRNVKLQKPKQIEGIRLPYLNKKWIKLSECPYCRRPVKVIIDETHHGRNIYLKLP